MVDKVEPGDDMDEELGVPGVTGSHALQVLGHLGFAIQRLALLDLVNHLACVPLNLSVVLGETVKALCKGVSSIRGIAAKGTGLRQERWYRT